jgi:hypothetical protein
MPASAVPMSGMPVNGRVALGGVFAGGGWLNVIPSTDGDGVAHDGRAALATKVHDVTVAAGNEYGLTATAVTIVVELKATVWVPAGAETPLARYVTPLMPGIV